jgi:hypothetical protein
MTRLEALRGLYDAVKAGTAEDHHFYAVWSASGPDWFIASRAIDASSGSVDAALALIEATLPGWLVIAMGQDSRRHWYVSMTEYPGIGFSRENHKQLATALLLACLAALIAIEEGKE